MIEGHGNDIYKFDDKIIADFSSNIIYSGIPGKLVEFLSQKISIIRNYPEPNAQSLQSRIAEHHQLKPDNILAFNGSTEAFYLIAQLFHSQKTTIITPSFAEYEDACKSHKHMLTFLSNQEISEQSSFNTKTVWIGNPNNPDGKITPPETIIQLCQKHPDTYFIIDEAYGDLCINHKSLIPYTSQISNLIVVCSLTKNFAIPGIRLGYMVTHNSIQQELIKIKAPWSVNTLAIEAGKFILKNYHDFLPDKNELIKRSSNLQEELNSLDKLEVKKSCCNYFLVELKKGNAADLKEFLIHKHGILIRDASNFRGLSSPFFRLAVQGKKENQLLVKGIKEWLLNIS